MWSFFNGPNLESGKKPGYARLVPRIDLGQRAAIARGLGTCADFIASGRRRSLRAQGIVGSGSAAAAIADFSQRRSFFMAGSSSGKTTASNLTPHCGADLA